MPKMSIPRAWALAVAAAAAVAAGSTGLGPAAAAMAQPRPRAAPATNDSPATAASPHLTADTPAACNKATRPGFAQCFAIVRTPADHVITADSSGPPSTALGPADIQAAYNLPSATAGKGETMALVDAGNDADAESDLAVFRSHYGLPACTAANGCFEKVNQKGQQGHYPPDQGWGDEISLDLDAVSSACPNCHILLVEATNASIGDLGASVDEAVKLGAVTVSNSYGSSDTGGGGIEPPHETAYDKYYNHPGVAVTASAGDGGYAVNYPSASQYVTAAGGTTLTKDSSVNRGWDETVWGNGTDGVKGDGTGSGCSDQEPQPSWQAGVTRGCARRATTDISADADPASGLAVYDTDGEGGWLQVGGTSLASPLIAATYALAGTPAPGTYPSSYLYAHYLADPSFFNDITSGSNGDCGDVLCNAGPGWDGPTGLGTPDGVSGFAYTQTGSVTGTVTDASTGQPVDGAKVVVPRLSLTTGSSGTYTLAGLPAGSYRVTASGYGYHSRTQTVTVTAGQPTTQDFRLAGTPHETVSGAVTAGTGTAWPLYAKVTWSDGNGHSGTAYTAPGTGRYSLSLLAKRSYKLAVTPLYPGYQPTTQTVKVGTGNMTQNLTAGVNLTACTALGYHPALSGSTQTFTGATAPEGWSVSNINLHYPGYADQPGWEFTNPAKRANHTGGSGNFAIVDSDHDGAGHYQDTYLTSQALNFSTGKTPAVQFDTDLAGAVNSTATAGLSVDGGKTWTTLWRNTGAAGDPGPATVVVPLPTAAGKNDVRVRFGYTGEWSRYWEIDNVFLGNRTCTQQAGALLTGRVTGAAGNAIDGATVASVTHPGQKTLTVATPGDDSINGGLYALFTTAAGSQKFTAKATGYTSSTQSASLTAGQATTLDFTLTGP
jgi:Carboxypeptidase regulatory-like domain